MLKQHVTKLLVQALNTLGITEEAVPVTNTTNPDNGDFTSNIAMMLAKKLGKNPVDFAEEIKTAIMAELPDFIEKIEVARPGFLNIWITDKALIQALAGNDVFSIIKSPLRDKKLFIEYAHPNTHKEMHIGHMRTLITGEAVARLAEAAGAQVFRANYQGDIGLHVAKALYGITHLMQTEHVTLEQIASWSHADKAHFLGRGYAYGSQEYEKEKEAIDHINKELYTAGSKTNELYKITRTWSLAYYDEFYKRFYTKFDRLFFESEVAEAGVKIVNENIGPIFEKQNGAIVFPGEQYGLHTRVFITQAGNPTYEGKEMGNAFNEYNAFHFDTKIHVVGNEQAGYFQVVFKALELIDPEKFAGKQEHLSMGMVQFSDRKMSSRTGDVLRVDWLIDQVKDKVRELMSGEKIDPQKRESIIEQIAIGAIKYSVLQVGTGQNVAFAIDKSVTLEGNSGPYIQYVYARTQSVLAKADASDDEAIVMQKLQPAERELVLLLTQFSDVIGEAASRYAPNTVTNYLFTLAQAFNSFYQSCPILKSSGEERAFRLHLTAKTGEVIKKGLELLGIKAPAQM